MALHRPPATVTHMRLRCSSLAKVKMAARTMPLVLDGKETGCFIVICTPFFFFHCLSTTYSCGGFVVVESIKCWCDQKCHTEGNKILHVCVCVIKDKCGLLGVFRTVSPHFSN